jgi:tetratricopeptide (TPR) repeat protein
VDAVRERAAAQERTADAWLGAAPRRKVLPAAEHAWVRARVASHTDKCGAAPALEDAVAAYADAKAYEDVLHVATRGLALSPESTHFSRFRTVAFSMLKRHDEATVACGEAIALADAAWGPEPHGDPDPRWLLYFNRACEHALAGRRQAALDDLRHAVALNREAGPKALADDYFQSLWADPELSAVAYGVTAVSPDVLADEILFVKRNFFHGDRDEAVEVGKRAVAHARALGDPRMLAEALRLAGNAATYTGSPARGIALLSEAVGVSERAWPDDPGERAEAWHLLGAAHHAAREWDAAEDAYARAEALRRQGGGDDAPALAISLADRARLASDRGAPLAGVLALSRQAGELCSRVATRDPPYTTPPMSPAWSPTRRPA